MNKVTIDRELLEQVASEFDCDNDRYMLGRELRKVLAAPRQPEGEGIAWSLRSEVASCGLVRHMTDRKYQAQTQAIKQWYEPFRCQQCTDAQRAIAELREECERLKRENTNIRERWTDYGRELEAERDTLRQQLVERDAEIERLRVKLMIIASAEPGRHNIEWAKAMAATGNNESYAKWREAFDQRDKLAGLLRDERNWSCVEISCQRGVKDHCLCGTCRILRIDAALAEVNK